VSPRFDLVLRNGMLIIPGVGTVAADVGICGSRIAAIGDELSASAQDVLDAGGKVVLPGIFDPHVHIGNELSFEHEAQSETRAAILGGVTTIGIMVRSLEDSYFLHLPAFRRAMDEMSYVDSVFHLQIFTEQQIAEMPGYARQYGVRSFKFYMSGIPGIVNSVTDDVLFAGFKQAASIAPTSSPACIARPAR
jgi:dihydropyrimidinase